MYLIQRHSMGIYVISWAIIIITICFWSFGSIQNKNTTFVKKYKLFVVKCAKSRVRITNTYTQYIYSFPINFKSVHCKTMYSDGHRTRTPHNRRIALYWTIYIHTESRIICMLFHVIINWIIVVCFYMYVSTCVLLGVLVHLFLLRPPYTIPLLKKKTGGHARSTATTTIDRSISVFLNIGQCMLCLCINAKSMLNQWIAA